MTAGHLRCCGSSLFLKAKFGIGYLLKSALPLHLPLHDCHSEWCTLYTPTEQY